MDEITVKYDAFKIKECISLILSQKTDEESVTESFMRQNCFNVCRCLVTIAQDDTSKINEMQMDLFKNYQNIIAYGLPGKLVPIQIELTAFFNFIWWIIYYVLHNGDQGNDNKIYLPVIQRGIRRVSGISCKVNNHVNLTEDLLYDLKTVGKKLKVKDFCTVSLLAEVVVLIFMYVLKVDDSMQTVEKCLESLKAVIEDFRILCTGLKAVKRFETHNILYKYLYKFGFLKMNSTVADSHCSSIDCLDIIKTLCLFKMKNYEKVLSHMKENINTTLKQIWCYLGGLSSLMLNDFNQCLGFVFMCDSLNVSSLLKSRFSVLQGLVLSRKKDYKASLKCFGEAKKICSDNMAAYYFMGEEYGKMGLNDEMIECLKVLIQVKEEHKSTKSCGFSSDFESVIINLLHPADEITESEVIYAAAVACGITNRNQEASEFFEKYFRILPFESEEKLVHDRIIKTPDVITALHEAATMNIKIGNFSQSEQYLTHASNKYTKKESIPKQCKEDVHVKKDINWVLSVLNEELGLNEKTVEESGNFYTEELVFVLDEDLVALMLSTEMERRMELETYKTSLGKLISVLSKYLAHMQKKEVVAEEEKTRLNLFKALSCKTYLNIAKCQMREKYGKIEIERTFKRALSCNQGDKDVLHEYCRFLLNEGKPSDAQKLWKTFCGKESIVSMDECQSLALRFLLESYVTRRDLEKLKFDLESPGMDVDFDLLN